MFSFNFKKKSLIFLLTLAVILLAANIVLQYGSTEPDIDEINLTEVDIANRFKNILSNFGIDDKFIKETKSFDDKADIEISKYKIQVPKDLSIPEILLDVYNSFRKDSLSISSIEKTKGGKTILTLKFGGSTLLSAEFEYLKSLTRNKGFISFIIYDSEFDKPETISLIESPMKLNFLVRPKSDIRQDIDLILRNNQQYSVLIDDDISEQKYKLGPNFSEQRIVTVIKTLVSEFEKSVCFVVDNNSEFYRSDNYEVFKRELSKRKIKFFTASFFIQLNNDENLIYDFDEKISSLEDGGSKVFLLNEETYNALLPELLKFEKRGYRVITSSLAL